MISSEIKYLAAFHIKGKPADVVTFSLLTKLTGLWKEEDCEADIYEITQLENGALEINFRAKYIPPTPARYLDKDNREIKE